MARGYAPDIVQTNNVKSHFLVKLARLHKRHRWIAFHHGYTATDAKVKLYNQLDRWSLPSADRAVAVCGPFRDQLVSIGVRRERIRVLHNSAAVQHGPFDSATVRHKFGIPRTAKVLLTVGRLSYEKGHADLLSSLGSLTRTHPDLDWRWLVVGSGPEQTRLEALARSKGLAERIIFAGQQADVLPFYAAADAMVLPSHTEGSPHVVLEAMSAGIPIVATRVGGVPEILNQDLAVLVPPGDETAMTDAIADLLSDSAAAERRAEAARCVLDKRFSHEAYRRELVQLYGEVLRRN
jgi:glycosyltransferase involved in cell wall biosynthesis